MNSRRRGDKPQELPRCRLCQKPTREECSHVDCANRRPLTASHDGRGPLGGGCYKTPIRKE